jgi:GntR family transcriptional repressor for pyruvate dehydrogenase complex
MRFHQTVAAASGNRILTSLMNMVATILFDVRSKTVKRARDLKESAEMHRTIYRAIRKRDAEAASEAMRAHLMLAQKAQASEETGDAATAGGKRRASTGKNDSQGSWSNVKENEPVALLAENQDPAK